jgi:FkbM family methyltransferase
MKLNTRLTALICAYFFWKKGWRPGTIFNVGVGSAPELEIWNWQFPETTVVGIDPKHPKVHWNLPRRPYVQAFAWDGTATVVDGRPAVRLDEVAKDYPPPYFLWVDVDGNEMRVLRGATETLKQTRFVNIEAAVGYVGQAFVDEVHGFLVDHGFHLLYSHTLTEDRLYIR